MDSLRLRFSTFAISCALAVSFTGAASAQLHDHLKCYKVKDVATFKSATADLDALQAQFGLESCTIKPKAKQVCVPVGKTVTAIQEGALIDLPGDDQSFDRLCYKIKCPKVVIAPILFSDQFGSREVGGFKAATLCTPAIKGLPTTTSTTTTLPCVPQARECDSLDRDCDGIVDYQQPPCLCENGSMQSCGSDVGVCQAGAQTCTDGTYGSCQGAVGPTTVNSNEAAASLCNGLDDNCNGMSDEGCGCVPPATQPCGTDTGECVAGTESCQANGTYSGCTAVGPAPRQCDGLDRDCDGIVDYQQPPCACTNGQVQSCGSDVGVCEAGTQTCTNGAYGSCVGSVGPTTFNPNEFGAGLCNGLDDNCNGQVDEGC